MSAIIIMHTVLTLHCEHCSSNILSCTYSLSPPIGGVTVGGVVGGMPVAKEYNTM